MKNIIKRQRTVLKALSGKIEGFYLAGGTALSLFYFQHRLSVDLDFFTRTFNYSEITGIARYLQKALSKKVDPVDQRLGGRTARTVVYYIRFTAGNTLKLDFVEDTVPLLKKTKIVEGINILSLEDIYIRKIYALAGMIRTTDDVGRGKFNGGRADAKDFYDIYFLSHTFMPLSKFAIKYCDRRMMESIIRWFRTYDRMAMIDGLLTLSTNKSVDFKTMDRHFKKEIDHILDHELGDV